MVASNLQKAAKGSMTLPFNQLMLGLYLIARRHELQNVRDLLPGDVMTDVSKVRHVSVGLHTRSRKKVDRYSVVHVDLAHLERFVYRLSRWSRISNGRKLRTLVHQRRCWRSVLLACFDTPFQSLHVCISKIK
jgi:hypothetical protein